MRTANIELPLHQANVAPGKTPYMIANEIDTDDLTVNLADWLIMVLPGDAKRGPLLVLRLKDESREHGGGA